MHVLNCITPEELGLLTAIIAVLLSESLTTDETNVVGNFLVGVGSVMLTIAAQEALLQSQQSMQEQTNALSQQVETIRKQVALLNSKLR